LTLEYTKIQFIVLLYNKNIMESYLPYVYCTLGGVVLSQLINKSSEFFKIARDRYFLDKELVDKTQEVLNRIDSIEKKMLAKLKKIDKLASDVDKLQNPNTVCTEKGTYRTSHGIDKLQNPNTVCTEKGIYRTIGVNEKKDDTLVVKSINEVRPITEELPYTLKAF